MGRSLVPLLVIVAMVVAALAVGIDQREVDANAAGLPGGSGMIMVKADSVPCGKDGVVAKPQDVLVTKGNQWTYSYVTAWHSSVREKGTITLRVEAVEQLGAVTVARMKQTTANTISGETFTETFDRVAKGEVVCDAFVGHDPVKDATAAEALMGQAERCFEYPAPTTTKGGTGAAAGTAMKASGTTAKGPALALDCSGPACVLGVALGEPYEWGAVLWEPVGFVSWWSAWYSAETGDGTTTVLSLQSYSLVKGAPVTPATVEPPPASFETFKKTLAEAVAKGPDAVAPHVHKSVVYSINPEHDFKDEAIAAWKGDNNAAMTALADILKAPCTKVTASGKSFVVCPSAVAYKLPPMAGACSVSKKTTSPRAVFVELGGTWNLVSLLLGGVDDLYAAPEWTDAAPRPWSQQDTFK